MKGRSGLGHSTVDVANTPQQTVGDVIVGVPVPTDNSSGDDGAGD